jgi:hypothetical protein
MISPKCDREGDEDGDGNQDEVTFRQFGSLGG